MDHLFRPSRRLNAEFLNETVRLDLVDHPPSKMDHPCSRIPECFQVVNRGVEDVDHPPANFSDS